MPDGVTDGVEERDMGGGNLRVKVFRKSVTRNDRHLGNGDRRSYSYAFKWAWSAIVMGERGLFKNDPQANVWLRHTSTMWHT